MRFRHTRKYLHTIIGGTCNVLARIVDGDAVHRSRVFLERLYHIALKIQDMDGTPMRA